MRCRSTKKEFFLKCQGVNRAMGKGISGGRRSRKNSLGQAYVRREREGRTVVQSDQEDGCTTQTEQKVGPWAGV